MEQRQLPRRLGKPKLREQPRATVSAFVQLTDDPEEWSAGGDVPGETARRANLRTVELSAGDALALGARPSVVNVELGQPLRLPDQKVESGARRPRSSLRRVPGRRHRSGEGVLVGLIDVGGFDFTHPDFDAREELASNGSGTREGRRDRRRRRAGRATSTSGSELRKDELDRALAAAGRPAGLRARAAVADVPGLHATHVASIAAATEVARKARIAGVLISIPDDEAERRLFYDSSRLAHAVDYPLEARRRAGRLPLSINISLGTNGHAHDDSSAVSRWIDAALTSSGRSVCVAAGNAGQERAEHDQDIGYIMGRVHARDG